MSKQVLAEILDQISSKVVNSRESYNSETHKYTVQLASILQEVDHQLNDGTTLRIPKERIAPYVEDYCEELYHTFKSYRSTEYYNVSVMGHSNSFIVLVETLPGRTTDKGKAPDVFKFIKSKRIKALDTLRTRLIQAGTQYMREQRNFNTTRQGTLVERVKGAKTVTNARAGGLLEMGHEEGSSVIEHELLEPTIRFSETIKKLPARQSSIVDGILADMNFKMVTNGQHLRTGNIIINIFDQSKRSNNAQSNVEASLRKRFQEAIRRTMSEIDFVGIDGSPNVYGVIKAKVYKQALKGKWKGASPGLAANADKVFTSKATKKLKSKLKTTTYVESLAGGIDARFEQRTSQAASANWASIINIINSQIQARVAQNMKSPRLVYRSGAFSRSVKVTGVEQTRMGYPSFVFDYARSPYNVFDKYVGRPPWNTPARDPKDLVDLSIRQIMREMAVGRFYLRRAVR